MLTETEQATISEAREILRRFISEQPILTCYSGVVDYLTMAFAGEKREVFRVLFLDRRNRLIEDWDGGVGTVDRVMVYPREIIRRAIELGACAMVLSHNHPSGDPEPSPSDISMTKEIVAAANLFDITIHDHIVIGAGRTSSLRSAGHI